MLMLKHSHNGKSYRFLQRMNTYRKLIIDSWHKESHTTTMELKVESQKQMNNIDQDEKMDAKWKINNVEVPKVKS
jgi:hypothetical protein